MKKSEKLKEQAAAEDNDSKALGLYTKSIREARSENFVDKYLPQLKAKGYLIVENNHKFTIDTYSELDVIDFFPKANKLLIRNQNKWIKPGLPWILKHLL